MDRNVLACLRVLILVTLPMVLLGGVARAQAPATTPRAEGQGVAVFAIGGTRAEAFTVARAVYASRLRPRTLDEIRARVLAGDPPPANASRELRELAEIRAGIVGDDVASRRLLAGIARQVGAEALLLVMSEAAAVEAGNSPPAPKVVARLFLVGGPDSGELDAARYSPEPGLSGTAAWTSTVVSLEGRFPEGPRAVGVATAMRATPPAPAADEKTRPFYASAWFWGAIGAAALLGGAFYVASQDTSSDPIHLQMRVPK